MRNIAAAAATALMAPNNVEELVALTHNPNRPDPFVANPFDFTIFFNVSERILLGSELPRVRLDRMNFTNYLHRLEDEITAERLDELEDGAEPTQQETDLYCAAEREAIKSEDYDPANGIDRVVMVWRLVTPETESRAVYFATMGVANWWGETDGYLGPFRDVEEVGEMLRDTLTPPFIFFSDDVTFPEKEAFDIFLRKWEQQAEAIDEDAGLVQSNRINVHRGTQ